MTILGGANMRFICGMNIHDFYFIPTIRMERHCEMKYLTAEWIKWYVGIQWEVEAIKE